MDLETLAEKLQGTTTVQASGHLRDAVGGALLAQLPGARIGEMVRIERSGGQPPLMAEVRGFREGLVLLLPLGDTEGLGAADRLVALGHSMRIQVSDLVMGRVMNALGEPIDGLDGPDTQETAWREVVAGPPPVLGRERGARLLPTGVRAIDGLLSLAEGQRVGLFAGAGVGKSSLLSQIARDSEADVYVACLLGERSHEVPTFIEEGLGDSLARGCVVVAGSHESPLLRVRAAQSALTLAEHFRDQGKRVLLLMDSLTRYARALRDLGLALGEMPARRGFPPSVFAALPRLLERCGRGARGSITGIFSVLVEGDEREDPIADELRGLLDGHIELDRTLAERGHFPAISIPRSLSRMMPSVVAPEQLDAAQRLRGLIALHESKRDLITLGAYRPGSDPELDRAVRHADPIAGFLQQPNRSQVPINDTFSTLLALRKSIDQEP